MNDYEDSDRRKERELLFAMDESNRRDMMFGGVIKLMDSLIRTGEATNLEEARIKALKELKILSKDIYGR